MSEFDGKQYYGFSMQNNQNLSTTTKNFEFRYMRPEFLEKAIQKVNSKDDSKMQQRNKMMENFRQIRPATPEIEKQHIKTFKRDQDVETQINTGLIKETEEIRKLSNSEIDNLMEKIKQKNEASSSRIEDREANKATSNFMRSELRQHDMISRCIEKNSDQIVDTDQKDQSSICTSITKNKTIHMVDNFEPQISIAQTPEIIDNVMLEEYRRPQPKWVEIEEPRIETRMEIDIKCNDIKMNSPKTVRSPYSPRYDTKANMKYYQLPPQQFSQINQCIPPRLARWS